MNRCPLTDTCTNETQDTNLCAAYPYYDEDGACCDEYDDGPPADDGGEEEGHE